jgi:hypothetical protein
MKAADYIRKTNRADWMEPDNRPVPVRASTRPAFRPGQQVAVVTLADPPETLYGELRAVDDTLAVVLIAGRSLRVPVELIRPLDDVERLAQQIAAEGWRKPIVINPLDSQGN